MCSWEFGIFSITQGITDGGRAGLIWMSVIHAIGFVPVVVSMAEMASIAPTAGGQYVSTS
jgi:choline transport protein